MIKFALRTVAVALLALSTAGLASAEQFTLTATLAGGGTLMGTFTTTSSMNNMLMTYDITASPGLEYTNADSTVASILPSEFFKLTDGINVLQIFFSGGLNAVGTTTITAGGSSFDDEAGVTRDVLTGGMIVPAVVPEPASIGLMSSALAIALGGAWVRRRRAVAGRRLAS